MPSTRGVAAGDQRPPLPPADLPDVLRGLRDGGLAAAQGRGGVEEGGRGHDAKAARLWSDSSR